MFTLPLSWSFFLSDDPLFRSLQLGLIAIAVLDVFFILFTTRDIILRTHSFVYQLVCILLVAFLPFIGFFLYLLIRPSRTNMQRETDRMLREVLKSKKSVGGDGGEGIGFPKTVEEDANSTPHQSL
ncbi:MAG TPA: PLD nuclease N-terminal domain-containing protein [Candidatus Peribacteraceae bacterium]|nr:PLD nuclease N-terminal domain-containing protein [Candidatus Peribacteraceae bacterium]